MNNEELKQHARNIRKNIVKEIANAQSGHPGGSLGAADIVTYLYFEEMDITPENAGTIDRDRFVLSKGHTSPLLYAALAEKGIIPMEELMTFRKLDSKLQGHPNMNY
ncbi:MAG: transketolase, partial [Stecheria intestinalis]|nr:transketolase [Stecheria intestinalis]MDD7681236.1 transketolase [Stecheria intestinalis]